MIFCLCSEKETDFRDITGIQCTGLHPFFHSFTGALWLNLHIHLLQKPRNYNGAVLQQFLSRCLWPRHFVPWQPSSISAQRPFLKYCCPMLKNRLLKPQTSLNKRRNKIPPFPVCVCYSPHRCPLIQGFYLKKAHRHTSHTRSVCPTKRQCDKEQVQRVRSDLCPCRWKVSALTHCYRALPHMEGTAYVCVCTVWPELQSRQ